jgi:hypothetical protein
VYDVLRDYPEFMTAGMDDPDLRGRQADVFTRLEELERRVRTCSLRVPRVRERIRGRRMKAADRERNRRKIRSLRWLAEVLLPPHRLLSRIARYELGAAKRSTQVRIQVMRAAREVFGVPGKSKSELVAYCPSLIEGGGAGEEVRHRALCVLGLLQTRKSKWCYWKKKKQEEIALLKELLLAKGMKRGWRKVV